MRAGQVFMETLVQRGSTHIFGNPGSTENPVLDRLVDYPSIAYHMMLHESCAVAGATFHAMATGRTGIVNIHVAPGLGNAIGAMFGTLKAGVPLIVTAGQQDVRMRFRQKLFAHDLVAMAAPVTKWSVEPRSADEMAPIIHRAFEIANEAPCGPVFVSLPVDVMEQETSACPIPVAAHPAGSVPAAGVSALVDLLRTSKRPAIVVGDDVAAAGAVANVVELAERIGACVYREAMHARTAFPTGHPAFRGRLGFDPRNISAVLAAYDTILLAGGLFFEELWFEDASPVPDTARVARVEASAERLTSSYRVDLGLAGDIRALLQAANLGLVECMTDGDRESAEHRAAEVRAAGEELRHGILARMRAAPGEAPLSSMRVIHEIAKALPPDAILVDESLTAALMDYSSDHASIVRGAIYSSLDFGFDLQDESRFFSGRGGGLGQAMPGACGIQIAHPDRPVVALVGDGSAMYGIQALWTAAHESLPVVFVIFSNREYRVLKHNLDTYRHRFGIPGGRPYPSMDLTKPSLGFVEMARGMGVGGETASTARDLAAAVARAMQGRKPYLIDVAVAGKA